MSKMRKEIQEQLQKDEVAETLQNITDNVRENRNLLVSILVVAVLAILVFYAVRGHRTRVLRESNGMLSQVIQNYEGLVNQSDPKQREESFKETIHSADTLTSAFPGTKLGREALFMRGRAYYEMDRFADAQKDYQAYLDKAQNDEERARGKIALGYACENNAYLTTDTAKQRGLMDKAMANFKSAQEMAEGSNPANPEYPYLATYAIYCQARLNELAGKNAEAIALYTKVKDRPEPVVRSKEKENRPEQDVFGQYLSKQIEAAEGQLSFQAMAKTRLEQLSSTPKGPARVTTEVKAAPAPTSATQSTKKP